MLHYSGSALGALLWVSSLALTDASVIIQKRGLVTPSTLPGTWNSQGCYVDVGRTLTGGGYTNDTAMTDESCIAYCEKAGYIYAGIEYSQECYCGNTLTSGAVSAPTTDCSMACTGNSSEACGGPNRLNLFWSGTTGPQTNPGTGLWKFSGCYAEGTTGRTLTVGATTLGGSSNMTVANCLISCQSSGYALAGIEYSGECYCDNSIQNGGALAPDGLSGCSMLCNGNFSEYCGGPSRLDVYDFNNEVTLPPYTTIISTQSSTSTISSSSTTPTTPPTSTSTTSTSTNPPTSTTSTPSSSSTSSVSSTTATTSSTSTLTSTSATSQPISSSSSTASSTTSTTLAPTTTGPPANKATVGPYIYLNCYTEATNARALAASTTAQDLMTVEVCETFCAGYTYFGIEYGRECYCGNQFSAGSIVATATDCSFPCGGDGTELCGAGNRLSVYVLNGTVTSSSSTTGTATSTSTSTSITVSVTSSPTVTGLPAGWSYMGCYVDNANGRVLPYQQQNTDTTNTIENCVSYCAGQNFTVAGVEFGSQCFCGDAAYGGAVLAANQADCTVDTCSGDSSEFCGSGNRMSMYSIGTPTFYPPTHVLQDGLPAGWKYSGCLQDNILAKENAGPKNGPPNLHTLPYELWDVGNTVGAVNDPIKCVTQCQSFGFTAAGLEYGQQCYCGDAQNLVVASAPGTDPDPRNTQFFTYSELPQIVPDSNCNAPCLGNFQYLCGGGNLLTYYSWDAENFGPLYEFDFPAGNDAGEYSLLIGGLIVPLIVTQGVNGKVNFLEKYGTGESNGTDAYELDLSLVDNYQLAWRGLTGLQTDVFCAAGLTLPDKAGRQLTAGGWTGDAATQSGSTWGVRLYWPDGSAGVNGTNNWAEDPINLKLQVARWYPSGMIMANGSILIVGGEIGQNDEEQPTLELLPATGVKQEGTASGYSNTTVYLDFLARTWPFNLYPFVCVIPEGIFIGYYNEARILDEVTFETIKVLPNMPGSVDDPLAGRTYQLEGAMVLLPQHAPYTDHLGVLVCGGASTGHRGINNCISTQPGADNPTWTIERMPSERVMPCMAGLPDGTYLILNGAYMGAAGFGIASSPNYNAVIYDPTKPVNHRMSVMANTTVARLYHSEATLLLDGRVLVSGSDPTGQYPTPQNNYQSPVNDFPEEYRVEVFTPPYLLSGLPRPTFTIENTDWAYGETVAFTVTSGNTANLRVSLLGSTVSTHGNSMGQRTIIPAFSCNGNSCTVTAPPNAHISPPGWFMMFILDGPTPAVGQFVRIGGDPAGLGNWPDLDGFDLPGV